MKKDKLSPLAVSLAALLAGAGVAAATTQDGQTSLSLQTAGGESVQISSEPVPAVDEFILLDGAVTEFTAQHVR